VVVLQGFQIVVVFQNDFLGDHQSLKYGGGSGRTQTNGECFALKGEETDRVPVYSRPIGATRQLVGSGFPEFSQNSELAAYALIHSNRIVGDEIFLVFIDLSVEVADFGQEILYPENITAHPNYDNPRIKDVKDYGDLRLVNPVK